MSERVATWSLFALATGFYVLTQQRWLFGDGIFFVFMVKEGWLAYHNVLYLPLASATYQVTNTLFGATPDTALKLLSALCGGVGVAMTYRVARRALTSDRGGLAVAWTLTGLAGYWFHATAAELHSLHVACALLLLAGFMEVLDDEPITRKTWWMLGVGAFLTPLSHTTGMAMGLPAVYVLWRLYREPETRRAAILAAVSLATGFVAFATVYVLVMLNSKVARGATSGIAERFGEMVENPDRIPGLLMAMGGEFLLYAIPAATLVPAGLRTLYRTAPRYASLCLLWIIAWPIAVVWVGDYAMGSYHTPTFPVTVLLAVVALHALDRSVGIRIGAMALACLPMLGLYFDSTALGLGLWLVGATGLFVMSGEPRGNPVLMHLPITTLVITAPLLLPMLLIDPYRPRIDAVAKFIPRQDIVLYLSPDVAEHTHWLQLFPGAEDRSRAFNPLQLEHVADDAEADRMIAFIELVVQQALQKKERVWVVGDLAHVDRSPRTRRLFDGIEKSHQVVLADGAPELVYVVRKRD